MEELLKAIGRKNIVLVIGSGVSASITKNQNTSTWVGLIHSGREFVLERNSKLGENWNDIVKQLIKYGTENNNTGTLINAAGMVSTALKDIAPQTFSDWLKSDIGNLPILEDSIARSILSFPFPIFTTNYDTLLEQIGKRESANWTDANSLQAVLAKTKNSIGHLHGIWDKPDSIVLSDGDYEKHANSDAVQYIEKAMSGSTSIIYVGFGSGFGDPNFSKLLAWHRNIFPNSAVTHFRLCLKSEMQAFVEFHNADNIQPIEYGENFSELSDFLNTICPKLEANQLTESGIARDLTNEIQKAWVDEMKAESIISEIHRDEARELSELILPPVLLPVPHSEYVKANSSKDKANRIDRLDPEKELQESNFLLIVAEDGIGLTTALRWLAWKAALSLPSTIPLYVNFRQCKKGAKPLEEMLKRAALSHHGLLPEKSSTLPPYVLALDDFSPSVGRISEKVIQSLANLEAEYTIIGCKQGSEERIVEQFNAVGVDVRVRYLGQINEIDIARLAKLATPFDSEKLAENVVTILRSENLPRNPFTVSLLIAIILRGGKVASNASQTAILDQYVNDLLGRGDPYEDARLSIDQSNRVLLLASLAQHFVDTSSAGLAEDEILKFFSTVFSSLGWPGRPSELLHFFLQLRVLRYHGKHVTFGRNSYLYLFAAKRADKNKDFLNKLIERPLYYASILKPYSALTRDDVNLLQQLSTLLDDLPSNDLNRDTSFQEMDLIDAPESIDSDDNEKDTTEEVNNSEVSSNQENVDAFSTLDILGDDLPAFPADLDDELSFSLYLFKALDLVSTVLRDSDQILDLELKRKVLIKTLACWGTLITTLDSDQTFHDLMLELSNQLATELLTFDDEVVDLKDQEELASEIMKAIPPSLALGGITGSLASRKLISVFNEALQNSELHETEEGAIAAAFFVLALREKGWASQLSKILENQKNIWIIRDFIQSLLRYIYVLEDYSDDDEGALKELCAEIYARSLNFRDSGDRNYAQNRYKNELAKLKLQNSRKQLGTRSLPSLDTGST